MLDILDKPVLVVDDQKTMTMVMAKILESAGARLVDVCNDGAAAVRMFRTGGYGLVITDWKMKPVDGLHVLRAVRLGRIAPTTPVIVASVDAGSPAIRDTALRYGADIVLAKPFSADRVREALGEIAARRARTETPDPLKIGI